MVHNAVELPVDLAWSIADRAGAGSFPWVLAITPPERPATAASLGPVDPAVTNWLRVVCHPQQWFELRYVRTGTTRSDLLRGVVARRDGRTVVALRNAQLLTLTVIRVEDADSLAPILTVGLDRRPAARFTEFAIPARIGARADEQLRSGAELDTLVDYLGVPGSARPVVRSAFSGPRSYVEVVAGQNRDGVRTTSSVGLAVIDSTAGRVLVTPHRAPDGEWISNFTAGSARAIGRGAESLAATLTDGRWFPDSCQPLTERTIYA